MSPHLHSADSAFGVHVQQMERHMLTSVPAHCLPAHFDKPEEWHMKRCLKSLTIRERAVKTPVRYPLTGSEGTDRLSCICTHDPLLSLTHSRPQTPPPSPMFIHHRSPEHSHSEICTFLSAVAFLPRPSQQQQR